MEKYNVLMISSLYHPHIGGGAEVMLKIQAEGFVKQGYSVSVLTTHEGKDILTEVINGVNIYRVPIKNFYWNYTFKKPNKVTRFLWHLRDIYNVSMKRYFKKIIEDVKPSIIVCHNITGWSVSIIDEIKKYNIPNVQVLHDQYYRCPNSNMFKNNHACEVQCSLCSLMRIPHRRISSNLSAVVGVSSYVVDGLTRDGFFSNVPTHVIHNAREIKSVNDSKQMISTQPINFGFLGTLSQAKGIEWLIEQYLKIDINGTLAIGGRGDETYEKQLKEKTKGSNIKFLGYMDSQEFYSMIDVLVVPSIWPDTFPGVAFEAPANNIPVIASNIGGLPEIIRTGENGLLCDISNENSLGEAMALLDSNRVLLGTLITNCKTSVETLVSVDRMMQDYLDLFSSLITPSDEK